MLYTDAEIKKRRQREIKIKEVTTIIIYIIIVPLIIYNICLILQAIINPSKTPSFLGIKTYVIISGSMQPELEIGDIVVAKNVKEDELKKGDIICFRQGQSVITHRISEIIQTSEGKEYITKGDNNNSEDSGTITYKLIEGKAITKIPYIGNISLLLQDKIVIILIIVIFYVYLMYTNKIKNKKDTRSIKRIEYENMKENKKE